MDIRDVQRLKGPLGLDICPETDPIGLCERAVLAGGVS